MSATALPSGRTGGYAVAYDRGGLWSRAGNKGTTPQPATKGRRTKAPPPIEHQIFKDYSERTSDSYWKSILDNASIGKFPRGFSYQDGILIYKQRSKIFRLVMSDVMRHEFGHTEVIEFFTRSGLWSASDQERIRREQEDRDEEGSIDSLKWASIRKNKIKDILISGFVDDLSTAMNLTPDQGIQLKTMIGLGFILGFFDGDNVVMANGKIQAIDGIVFDQSKQRFEINPSLTPKKTKTKKTKTKPEPETELDEIPPQGCVSKINFVAIWMKYLELLSRKRIDPNQELPTIRINSKNGPGSQNILFDTDTDITDVSDSGPGGNEEYY